MSPELSNRLLEMTLQIQQIPAPTFQEQQRAMFVCDRLAADGLSSISIDDTGNVYACLPGRGSARPLVVSAHLDTVFPSHTDLSTKHSSNRLYGAGIGDNSLGVAGLFGLVWSLKESAVSLPGDLWLVANVGEEGLGDLCGMRAVVDRFTSSPIAYIVLEGMAFGQIYTRGLGVKRYLIECTTTGGHSWVDYGRPSAIHELAALISRLTNLPLPEEPRTTLNVGVISGGTSINTIAAQSVLELDLRSEHPAALEALVKQVENLTVQASHKGVHMHFTVIGQRPAGEIAAGHPLVRLAQSCLEQQGVQPRLNIGSTDANIPFSRGFPALCVGLSTGAGAHTQSEYINIAPVTSGLAQLVSLVTGAYEL
jgi:acetylornithine deacetylase/succinyl-diaminopimelate desuccinylase-like protein